MSLESKLLEAVKHQQIDEVKSLLKSGADLRHDDDAPLRVAVLNRDEKMRELILNRYPDEVARKEAVERVASNLEQMIDDVRKRHTELIARRIIKELCGPPVMLE